MKHHILITGANRGLGLEFVRQYANEQAVIFACCRDPSKATDLLLLQKKHSNIHIHIHKLDVTSATDILTLSKQITEPVDILINNAGKLEHDGHLGDISVEKLTSTFLTNAVAPLKITEAFIGHLRKGEKKMVVAISSKMGSIQDNISGGNYSYRTGKAALNMLMRTAAVDLKADKIKVLLLHPGWVKTSMGGDNAPLQIQDSVAGMRLVIQSYSPPEGEAMFYDFRGNIVPW